MTGTKTFCTHQASTKNSQNRDYWNSQGSDSKQTNSGSGSSSSSSSRWGIGSGWSSSSSSYSTSSSSESSKISPALKNVHFANVEGLKGW